MIIVIGIAESLSTLSFKRFSRCYKLIMRSNNSSCWNKKRYNGSHHWLRFRWNSSNESPKKISFSMIFLEAVDSKSWREVVLWWRLSGCFCCFVFFFRRFWELGMLKKQRLAPSSQLFHWIFGYCLGCWGVGNIQLFGKHERNKLLNFYGCTNCGDEWVPGNVLLQGWHTLQPRNNLTTSSQNRTTMPKSYKLSKTIQKQTKDERP